MKFRSNLLGATAVLALTVPATTIGLSSAVGASPATVAVVWSARPTPQPAGVPMLKGVSCTDYGESCEAVGFSQTVVGGMTTDVPVAMGGGDNGAWSLQPAPTDGSTLLSGVSCTSPSYCVAVGAGQPSATTYAIAEQWTGASWSLLSTASLSSRVALFQSVSCNLTVGIGVHRLTQCTAVGSYLSSGGVQLPLVESFVDGQWTVQPAPVPSGTVLASLLGVSCSSVKACMAVGYYETSAGKFLPLAESWSAGASWTIEPTPAPNSGGDELLGVSCPAAGACMAVGGFPGSTSPLSELWNGTSWTVKPVPTTSFELLAVSCTSVSICEAVALQPTALSWEETSWGKQAMPVPSGVAGASDLGVTCTSPTACVAVGETGGGETAQQDLVEVSAAVT